MQKRSIINIFILFLILSISVFLLFKVSLFKPIVEATQNILLPFISIRFIPFQNTRELILREQNLNYSKKLVDQSKIIADNKALRDQFSISYPLTNNLIEAKVVAAPAFIPGVTLPQYLIINKGAANGIVSGQAVIYKDNLVGLVKNVGQNFSKINLVTSSEFSTTAITNLSNSLGVAKGQGGGQIILDNVDVSQNIVKDELVMTKGDIDIGGSGVIPNLIIGKVISINKKVSSLFQVSKVESLLDFSKLTTVFIVK